MDEVVPGLWIGDLASAMNVEKLKSNHIYSVLTAMRGKISINPTFIRHQILLDDTEDADVLTHLLPSISFIQAELEHGRGVLVHCHAGMSRSATIVAAYLMYTQNVDCETALQSIRKVRPMIQPNAGFLRQLEIFHQAAFKISRRDKTTRMFYMERAVEEIMNGDGSLPETDMFAKYPRTPSESAPATPGGPRRRIRCKMCRHELATREHMLDHGQLGAATPASLSPVQSRRPSMHDAVARRPSGTSSQRPSMSQVLRPRIGSSSDTRPRRPSLLSFGGGLSDSLTMSTAEPESNKPESSTNGIRRSGSDSTNARPTMHAFTSLSDSLAMSALEDDSEEEEDEDEELRHSPPKSPLSQDSITASAEASAIVGQAVSDIITQPEETSPTKEQPPLTTLINPTDLAAQLYANPQLSALRTGVQVMQAKPVSAPILANPKCSGYFVEPMKWMEPFLQGGQLAGKIVCPNKKCGAKLGNYDWAGVRCSCKEWVTPGFCIARSKVDDII